MVWYMAIVNLGSMNLDHIYMVPHFIQGSETLLAEGLRESLGGKGLNQSIAVARSGAKIFHAGMLGIGGNPLKCCLDGSGVDTSLLCTCDVPQGHTVIQIDPSGQNSIIVFSGSNHAVSTTYVGEILSRFGPGDYLMIQNEISNLEYALETACRRGMRVVLNASPINNALLKLDISRLEWLVVNELECSAMARCSDVGQAYEQLKKRFPSIGILLTLGAGGSVSWKDGEEIRQAAYPAKAVDTTGAGDTFVGYFTGMLAQGCSRREAMRLASMAASIAVSRPGAAPSIPVLAEVEGSFQY